MIGKGTNILSVFFPWACLLQKKQSDRTVFVTNDDSGCPQVQHLVSGVVRRHRTEEEEMQKETEKGAAGKQE